MYKNLLKAVIILAIFFAGSYWYHSQRVNYLQSFRCKNCNVVLVSIDTLRADALPCYGYKKDTAPNLCAFAEKNILFENHYSNADSTLPGHFSIMTGLYPQSHGMTQILTDSLSPNIKTLAQEYKQAGYETIYDGPENDNNMPLDKGFGNGFNSIIYNTNRSNTAWQKGLDLLDRNNKTLKPTFLFLHTYAVHSPYLVESDNLRFTDLNYPNIIHKEKDYLAANQEMLNIVISDLKDRLAASDTPESVQRNKEWLNKFENVKNADQLTAVFSELPKDEQGGYYTKRLLNSLNRNDPNQVEYFKALYDEGIYNLDTSSLKNLFDYLESKNLLTNTILVITSDHGERFMEHGSLLHGGDLYNETIKVPLLMAIPGVAAKKITALTQSIDIYPTLLNLTNIDPPNYVQGIDLTRLIAGVLFPYTNKYQISQAYKLNAESIQNGIWKFQMIKEGQHTRYELYDLLIDKGEKNNLADKLPWVTYYLKFKMDSILNSGPNFPQVQTPLPSWLDQLKRQKLEKEGYF